MNKVIITTADELDQLIQSSVRKALNENNSPTSTASPGELLTIDEACKFLTLAKPTLYGFTSKNQIPHIKRGKKLYFRKSELETWLDEGKRKSNKQVEEKSMVNFNCKQMENTDKPFGNVGLIELTYDMERKRLLDMVTKKARLVRHLDSEAYFHQPGTDIVKASKQVLYLREELNTCYGFLKVSDQPRYSYECQLDNMYECYQRNLMCLTNELRKCQTENFVLNGLYDSMVERCQTLADIMVGKKNRSNEQNRR